MTEDRNPCWSLVDGPSLRQGDLLQGCLTPVLTKGELSQDFDNPFKILLQDSNLIVVTQSCDLDNGKVTNVALCQVFTLTELEEFDPKFRSKGNREQIRRGRVEGLYMLPSPTEPEVNTEALVVDFREIFSLPFGYLSEHAESLGDRWRMGSPFVEHLSQAFARYFMRVGLPSAIPSFK